jgi:ESCRT-I complex subunit VPS28
LYASINAMSTLSDDFDAKVKVKSWYDKLHGMAAHEELSDETARQMIFELEADIFNCNIIILFLKIFDFD